MEKQQDMSLLKARSYRNVLSIGFRLYTENFRRLFKASWLIALCYALCCGAFGTLLNIKLPEMSIAAIQQLTHYQGIFLEAYMVPLVELLALALLVIAALSIASATILNKLKEHKQNNIITIPESWIKPSPLMMVRTLKGVFMTLIIVLLPILLFIGLIIIIHKSNPSFITQHLVTSTVAAIVYMVIFTLLELPLMYVLMKYLMEAPSGFGKTLTQHFGRGLHYWGALFLVFFVSTLMIIIAAIIVMLPAHILSFANQQAHLGVLMGDPLGMPSYILPLTFITVTLCSFIQFYICQVTLVHQYYIYGAIEAKEEDREQNTKDIQ